MNKLILLIFTLIICVIWDYLQDKARGNTIMIIQNQRNRSALNRRAELTKQVQRHQQKDTPQERAQLSEYHYKLFEVFYAGVPDKYGTDGNKIHGIKPDHQKALQHLILAFKISRDWNYLHRLAMLNQHGMYGMEPDLEYAKEYHTAIARLCPHIELRNESLEQLQAIAAEEHDSYVYGWLNLKRTEKKSEHPNKWLEAQQKTNKHQIPINRLFRANRDMTITNDDYNDTAAVLAAITPDISSTNVNSPQYDDPHNTHNSQVLSTIAHSIKKLKEQTQIKRDKAQSINDIREYLRTLPDNDKRRDALKSLNRIESSVIPLSFCDMKDSDALTLVWNRMNSETHKDNVKTLRENLFDELASMQEHNKTVCPTGRLTRIIDTLNVVDPEVSIKPTYAINSEMMTKASHVRDKMLEAKPEPEREKLCAGTSPDQDAFQEALKETIRGELQKDYVDTNILPQEKFDSEINKWIDEI